MRIRPVHHLQPGPEVGSEAEQPLIYGKNPVMPLTSVQAKLKEERK